MFRGFAETDAGIKRQLFGRYTLIRQNLQPLLKETQEIVHDAAIMRVELHGGGCALHVHQDDACTCGACGLDHRRVAVQGSDVVDDVGAGSQAGVSDCCLAGID